MRPITGGIPRWAILGYRSQKAMDAVGRLTSALHALQTLHKRQDEKELQNIINSARYFLDLAQQELDGAKNEP